MTRALVGAALATVILSGPAVAQAKGKIGSTSALVRERTGVEVPWPPDGRPQHAASDTIQALLQGGLTVDRAVRVALLNHRGLRAELEEVGVSQAEFRQALLPKNPTVEGEVRYGGAGRPGEIGVMQDLGSILLLPIRRQAAGARLERAGFLAAHAALELVRETRESYFDAQAMQQIRRFWKQVEGTARAAADLAQRQHAAGNISDLDLDNHQAAYESAKIELSKLEIESRSARERLNLSLGIWGDRTAWVLMGDLPGVPADPDPIIGLESLAISQRFDLAAADAEVRALAKEVSLARFSQFPELRAGVHSEREPEGTRTIGPAIDLSLPLFDRGQHLVASARARLRQAQDRQAALAVEIRSEVRAAHDRWRAARELVEYLRDVVLPRRARIVEQTQREYNFMLVGVYQLLQARQEEIGAGREYLEAQRDYWIAHTELEHALGGAWPTERRP